jgi:hypothetical protein
LKATSEQANKTQEALDLNTWSAQWYDQLIDFTSFPPFMVEGKAAVRQLSETETLWANTESLTVTPINTQFRVMGTTGLVGGQDQMSSRCYKAI